MRKKQLTVTPETIKHLTLTTEQLGAVIGGGASGTSVISQTPGTSVSMTPGTSVITPGTSVITPGTSVIHTGH